MRHRSLVPLLVLALGGCATVAPLTPPAAVAPDLAPQPLARRILMGVQQSPLLADFDRSMTVGPGDLTLRLTRARLQGARDVLVLRLVPRKGQTDVYARGWHEDALNRPQPDPYVEGSLATLVQVVKAASGVRVAVAGAARP